MGMVIELGESATVRTIDTLRASISEAFEQGPNVELDASALIEVDLSLVQLIEAARAHARQDSKSIRLTEPANSALEALLRRAGFLTDLDAEGFDFWCHGERTQ